MDKSKKKTAIVAAAAVLAAVGLLCCIMAFVNRDNNIQLGQVVAIEDESEMFFDLSGDVAAEKEVAEATCKANVSDGMVSSYEMRFSRKEELDEYLAAGENIYFASVDYGSGSVAIPMDNIKILSDITTNEYVLTLVPVDGSAEAARATGSEVRFYIAPKGAESSYVLFMAAALCEK